MKYSQLKTLFFLIGLASLVLFLAACGGNAAAPAQEAAPAPTEAPAQEAAPAAEEASADMAAGRCGDPDKLSDQLNVFNWADYMDPDILTQFQEECGVKVQEDIFSSNEDMLAKIQAGNSGYDVIVPSDYAIDIMVKAGLLAELDKSNIPNFKNLNPNNMSLYYDPENKYSVPFQWGTSGIAYNVQEFPDGPPDSWAVIFDPEQVCQHKGFVSVLDDERETIGAALQYLGYSYNDTDPAHHEEAKTLLQAQKECLAGYNSDNVHQTLAAEEVVLAHTWSGATALGRAENENIYFVIPKEGGAIWQDNVAIPRDAPHKYTAEVFINYLLEPEIGAQLSNYTYYFTPNEAAEPLLDPEYHDLLESGGMMIDDETYKGLEWIKRDQEALIFSDTWTAVKAQ